MAYINSRPLLTIAIPTYNRAFFLTKALQSIQTQLNGYENELEIIVSDNCSPDDTADVIKNFISDGLTIKYILNSNNLGPDLNIAQCFSEAKGKFVLVFGDDDFFLDGAIKKIMTIIRTEKDAGIVYIKGVTYNDKFEVADTVTKFKERYHVYHNTLDFVKRVNFYFTFTSGNIINKDFFDAEVNISDYEKTNLIQLGWTFPALIKAPYHIVVEQDLLGVGSVANTGGYKLFNVFCENFNIIMGDFAKKGFKKRYADVINIRLIILFFPHFLVMNRTSANTKLIKEDPSEILYARLGKYSLFWIALYPILILPKRICKFGLVGSVIIKRMMAISSFFREKFRLNYKQVELRQYTF